VSALGIAPNSTPADSGRLPRQSGITNLPRPTGSSRHRSPAWRRPAYRQCRPQSFGRDWGAGTLGVAATLAPRVTGLVSLMGQVGQSAAATYGAQAGLNVAF